MRDDGKTIRVVHRSSNVGSQGVLRHIPSRHNVDYARLPFNNARDCQFSRLIVPILDFRIVFGGPMDEDSDANEHIGCFGRRNGSHFDELCHSLRCAALRGKLDSRQFAL